MLIEPNLMELLDKRNNLTPREKQILDIIGTGKTTKQIADELGVSTSTVGNHRKHICKKLDLHSTAELVAYAVRNLNTTANTTAVYGK